MKLILLVAVLTPFVELAARVAARQNLPRGPPGNLSLPIFKRQFNVSQPGSLNIAQRDLIRLRNLVEGAQQRDSSTLEGIIDLPLTVNMTYGAYFVSIGIGCPPTFYELIVDTGSSNTWVGGNKPYVVTNTSVKTSDIVNITYGSGFMIGTEYTDSVTIAKDMVIPRQSIGVASNVSDIYPLDGILGLGPDDLTLGKLIPYNSKAITTVTDHLFEQGTIPQKLIAVFFEPTDSNLETNGELTFGGTNSTKFIGHINYFSITTAPLSKNYWGIDASFQYGHANGTGSVAILNTTAGIVDTGTTLFLLAPDAYNLYLNITGAVYDNTTGLLRISEEQYNNLQSLFFVIGDTTFELIPDAQLWPRALNTNIGGLQDGFYLVISNLGVIPIPHGTLDFILGLAVLERFYSVFDTTNKKVGLAMTQFTNSTIN